MKELIIRVNESDLTPSEKMCIKDYHPVELVRCNDCKWYDNDRSLCDNTVGMPMPREQTFFCADGRRKE